MQLGAKIMHNKNRRYQIIIVEENTTNEKIFVVKHSTFRILLWTSVFIIVIFFISLILDIFAFNFYFDNQRLKELNLTYVQQQISIQQLQEEINELRQYRIRVETLLGIEAEHDYQNSIVLPTDTFFYYYKKQGDIPNILVDEEEDDTLKMIYPARGAITQEFNVMSNHLGMDIALPMRTPVHAVESGVVKKRTMDALLGNTLVIAHSENIETIYGHNDTILVQEGMQVRQGQTIALSGNSGISSAPHLHFGIKYKDNYLDPEKYIN